MLTKNAPPLLYPFYTPFNTGAGARTKGLRHNRTVSVERTNGRKSGRRRHKSHTNQVRRIAGPRSYYSTVAARGAVRRGVQASNSVVVSWTDTPTVDWCGGRCSNGNF